MSYQQVDGLHAEESKRRLSSPGKEYLTTPLKADKSKLHENSTTVAKGDALSQTVIDENEEHTDNREAGVSKNDDENVDVGEAGDDLDRLRRKIQLNRSIDDLTDQPLDESGLNGSITASNIYSHNPKASN